MSVLVGNPEDRFSQNEAHILMSRIGIWLFFTLSILDLVSSSERAKAKSSDSATDSASLPFK